MMLGLPCTIIASCSPSHNTRSRTTPFHETGLGVCHSLGEPGTVATPPSLTGASAEGNGVHGTAVELVSVDCGDFAQLLCPQPSGRTLLASRKQLLTSSDLLGSGWAVYFKVQEPKTRRGAVVQHVRVEGAEAVHRFITAVLGPLPRLEKLYPILGVLEFTGGAGTSCCKSC